MKKQLLIIGMLISMVLSMQQESKAQGSVVNDPANLQVNLANQGFLSAIGVSMSSLEVASKKLEKIKQATDWIETLKSVQDFITIIETTTCMVKDLKMNFEICNDLGLLNKHSSCLSQFEYRININQLQSGMDFLNMLLSKGMSMDRGERMEALEMAMNRYTNAQTILNELNRDFQRRIARSRYEEAWKNENERFIKLSYSRYK
jgi:hypothetical protein